VRRIFKINVGLLSIADNSVPVFPGVGDGSKVDGNGRRSGRPPKVLLK